MKYLLFFIASITFFLASPVMVSANPDYARQTGKACGACHIDPAGGGKLTAEGDVFKDDLRIKGLYKPLTTAQHIIRFIVGYLHMLTGIIWFGTILYVHILLKPAYAAKGLPKGELMLGWFSIIIMAVTGTLLTIARIPSWYALFHTRFGILLTIKIALFLFMAVTAALVTFVIGPKLRKKKAQAAQAAKKEMTIEELSHFDGNEGRPAHVAYKGVIYDVTNSKLWRSGRHAGKHHSGSDLTDFIRLAPHGEEKITSMPLVGKLLLEAKPQRPPHEKVFYIFAYTNLAFVFLIVFVISLWRWW
jgi:predicted heme/steroid binding protein